MLNMKHCNVEDITSQTILPFISDHYSVYSTHKLKGETMTDYGIYEAYTLVSLITGLAAAHCVHENDHGAFLELDI
jgi:V8-like Glu-specific endopeptidase